MSKRHSVDLDDVQRIGWDATNEINMVKLATARKTSQ